MKFLCLLLISFCLIVSPVSADSKKDCKEKAYEKLEKCIDDNISDEEKEELGSCYGDCQVAGGTPTQIYTCETKCEDSFSGADAYSKCWKEYRRAMRACEDKEAASFQNFN